MKRYDCLIVDDEEALSASTCEYFNLFDIKTHWVKDKASCLKFFEGNKADLILLDINLGNDSGFELCKTLRNTLDVPILFISARTSDDDVLVALNIGGDDYIQKPYALSVLLAKVKATLKRCRGAYERKGSFGAFYIDYESQRLYRDKQEIELKAMEYKLLAYFVQNRNKKLTKEEIFAGVWGDVCISDGTLNVHIRRLREKIEEAPNQPKFIKTIWGTGYLFETVEG